MKHTIKIDELFVNKPFLQYETTLASSYGMGEDKGLSVRTTINGLSGVTDVIYIVRDRTKSDIQIIQLITSHLESAIDAYNRI